MSQKACAWIALITLLAALVPAGLGDVATRATGSCCASGQCPMSAGKAAMPAHCHGGDAAMASPRCSCGVAPGQTSAVPPTAFRFNVEVAVGVARFQPQTSFALPMTPISAPLEGYTSALDQPPRA
jgi:hypothetical protein